MTARVQRIADLLVEIGGVVTPAELDYQLHRRGDRLRRTDVPHLVDEGLALLGDEGSIEFNPAARARRHRCLAGGRA